MGVYRNEEAVEVNQDYGSERKRSNKKDDGQLRIFQTWKNLTVIFIKASI